MSGEGDLQPVLHPRLAPEVRYKFGGRFVELDESLEPEYMGEVADKELRELWRRRGLSKKDIGFNLRVLHMLDIVLRKINLVPLIRKKYRCSRIMGTSLAIKEIERCKQETRGWLREASHPLDKEALNILIYALHMVGERNYFVDYLREANRVDAVYSVSGIEYEGRVFREPKDELIEARFAVDAIWDGKQSKKHGATEVNKLLAKRRAPELDTSPKVVKARRSLGIPRGGFKDVEAAFQWSQKWSPDWSRRDDAYWQEVVWWESFTWVPYLERVMGRGYIMLDLPAMNQAVQDLVDGYDYLGRAWYRALPFYLIRGRLEPPPRILHRAPTERSKHQEILALWEKHQHDFKVVVSYNYGLTDADWEEIAEQEPAARLQYIRLSAQATIEEAALKIAERKGTLRDEEEWISEAYVRKLRSRKEVAKT